MLSTADTKYLHNHKPRRLCQIVICLVNPDEDLDGETNSLPTLLIVLRANKPQINMYDEFAASTPCHLCTMIVITISPYLKRAYAYRHTPITPAIMYVIV